MDQPGGWQIIYYSLAPVPLGRPSDSEESLKPGREIGAVHGRIGWKAF